jgi:hypothetical protein
MAGDLLSEIKRDMAFMGWRGPPDAGFTHKEDADGRTIARAHDSTWHTDYAESQARCERWIEREDREGSQRPHRPEVGVSVEKVHG